MPDSSGGQEVGVENLRSVQATDATDQPVVLTEATQFAVPWFLMRSDGKAACQIELRDANDKRLSTQVLPLGSIPTELRNALKGWAQSRLKSLGKIP